MNGYLYPFALRYNTLLLMSKYTCFPPIGTLIYLLILRNAFQTE